MPILSKVGTAKGLPASEEWEGNKTQRKPAKTIDFASVLNEP
jgi:hypothetical protein